MIKLSPKKTWEGFIGASLTTVFSAFVLADVMGRSQWLTCPRKDLSTGWLHCDPGPLFKPESLNLPEWVPQWFPWKEVSILPVQWHALCLGLFASIIAPFGGFFASGFKRAFKIKDFGDSIPGHGGITDRMDCQVKHLNIIATFKQTKRAIYNVFWPNYFIQLLCPYFSLLSFTKTTIFLNIMIEIMLEKFP